MKKIIGYCFLLSLLTVVFVVVNAPASWLYKQFLAESVEPYPVQVDTPLGVFWKGETSVRTTSDSPVAVNLKTIHWQWQFSALLEMKIVYRVELESSQILGQNLGDFTADVIVDFGGIKVQLKDSNSILTIRSEYDHQNKTVSGNVKLKRPNTDIENLLKFVSTKEDGSFRYTF